MELRGFEMNFKGDLRWKNSREEFEKGLNGN
jgi:hypothetical protein